MEFVGEFAFPGALNSSVTTLDLRNSSITHISNHAFANNNLETVYLPESIEFVHAEAFAGNPGTDGEGADLPGSSGIQKTLYETSFSAHCLYRLADGYMFMFNGCESINENDFMGQELTAIRLPNTVHEIDRNAFKNNQLVTVTIPDSVTEIREAAFAENQLTSVTLKEAPSKPLVKALLTKTALRLSTCPPPSRPSKSPRLVIIKFRR